MLRIDQLAYLNQLRHVHPIEKAVFTFLFLFFCLITKSEVIAVITLLIMSMAIVFGAKISVRDYIKLLLLPSFFLLSSVIPILISIAPYDYKVINSLWSMTIGTWQLFITTDNISIVTSLFFTVLSTVSCMYFLILSTPLHDILWLLQKMKLPTLFIELVAFTYRFIFVLLDKAQEVYIAQASRLGYQHYRLSIYSLGQLVVGVFVKSMKYAKELQIAVDTRGGQDGNYEIESSYKYHPLNWGIVAISMLTLTFVASAM
ncbi:cobalt ECF transporter T component CbiQ [Cytobacillus sp. IB215665]|uniref:cobalt ECF transporter T component CbiQ n=1 Tax=Cytobacillus sp. IB215665 TaxID=3097357 RepID=UPI002A143BCB|nr:cobalt ECF transporter T component CbiQ [Cytobacillus sp. IB215665]MDX8367324.1 cobalt ECF transporter T component CbiQ [Cytobacillus sp. IB215665]